jgi:hypothetical protein
MDDTSFKSLLISYLADELDIAQRDILQGNLEGNSAHRGFFLKCCQHFQTALQDADENIDRKELATDIVEMQVMPRNVQAKDAVPAQRTASMDLEYERFQIAEAHRRRKQVNLIVGVTIALVILAVVFVNAIATWLSEPTRLEFMRDLDQPEDGSTEVPAVFASERRLNENNLPELEPEKPEVHQGNVPSIFMKSQKGPNIIIDQAEVQVFPSATGQDLILFEKKPEGAHAPSGQK